MVQPARTGGVIGDEVGLLENSQVLRDGRAADGKSVGQFADGQRAGEEAVQNGPPGGIAESIELGRLVSSHLR